MNTQLKNLILTPFNILYRINPVLSTRLLYRLKLRRPLNLKQPQTYLEKLNWLKLYDRNPLLPVCADKYRARSYIEERGLGQYLPKLLWHGGDPEAIPFDRLPDQFVLKVSTGCGYNIICRDKASLDIEQAKAKLRRWMKGDYLPCYGEWMYAQSQPEIIVEEFLSDGEHPVPVDYKFFCFNGLEGSVGCITVDTGRYVHHKRNTYDRNWNFLPEVLFRYDQEIDEPIPKPACFEEMCAAAAKLAQPFVHVRVDFYVIGSRFYIGEMTFFNGAGFGLVRPESFNQKLGSWMRLPEKA